jgi:hypothetical protein
VPYQDYASECLAHVPEIGFGLAGRLVNRAWHDIRESRLWSWLTFEGCFVAPPIIGQPFNVGPPSTPQGTVGVTQYSQTVALDSVANAALNNLANPLITSRQFRAAPQNNGVYNIIAYDNAGQTLTLDRIYQGPTASGVPYQVYRCYYTPADANGSGVTDFLAFISMKNPTLGYRISRINLHRQSAEIDAWDPLRADQAYAYMVAQYRANTASTALGTPIYELWPHPTYPSGYLYLARRRGVELARPTDDIPLTLSKDMLVERALYYVSEWAAKNVGRFPQLRATDWRFQQTQHNKVYLDMLRDAKRQDDEIYSEMYIPDQWADATFLDQDLIVSSLLSTQPSAGWSGG